MAKPTESLFTRTAALGLVLTEAYNKVRQGYLTLDAFRIEAESLSRADKAKLPPYEIVRRDYSSWDEYRMANRQAQAANALALEQSMSLFMCTLNSLSDVYDEVAPWWVGYSSPPFEATATSALVGVLWRSYRLISHATFDSDYWVPQYDAATAMFVLQHCNYLPQAEVAALLRMETKRFLDQLPDIKEIPDFGELPNRSYGPARRIEGECMSEARFHRPSYNRVLEAIRASEREAESHKALANATSSVTETPIWDEEKMALMFAGQTVKSYRMGRPPEIQQAILEALQAAKWPEDTGVSVPNIEPIALNRAINALNKASEEQPISFHGDGTGMGVLWRRVQSQQFRKSNNSAKNLV